MQIDKNCRCDRVIVAVVVAVAIVVAVAVGVDVVVAGAAAAAAVLGSVFFGQQAASCCTNYLH